MEHSQDVKCIAWHPKEEILASASYDDTIKLYLDDPEDDWFQFATLSGHTSTVWSLAFSPCGRYLASCSDDSSLKMWKRERVPRTHGAPGAMDERWTGQLTIPNAHDGTIYSISWGEAHGARSDSATELGWLASAGGDGATKIWQLREKLGGPSLEHKLMAHLPKTHGDTDINAVSWCTREGLHNLVATVGDDGLMRVLKVVPNADTAS